MSTAGDPSTTDLSAAQAAAVAARAAYAAAPDDLGVQRRLVVALSTLAARLHGAGRPHEAVGLAAEAAGVLIASTSAGEDLRVLAEYTIRTPAYLPPGNEAADATAAGTVAMRTFHTTNPGAESDRWLLWALENNAARLQQAGRQPETAGLGTEASSVLATTALTGDALRSAAERVIRTAGYLSPGDEAIAATGAGTDVIRSFRTTNPGAESDRWLLWALENNAARLQQAGRQPETAGLGTEASSVLATTALTGDALRSAAERVIRTAGYLSPGDEAIAATRAGTDVMRAIRRSAPGPTIDFWTAWALHNLAVHLNQVGLHGEIDGLGDEASAIVDATQATGPQLQGLVEQLARLAGYLLPGEEQARAGTIAARAMGRLFAENPSDPQVAATFGWIDDLRRRWREAIGLPAEEPAPVARLDPALRHHFDDGAPLAVISRNPDQMDVYAVGRDGTVQSTWWNGQWRERFRVGTAVFPPSAPITAQSRNPNQMDLWVVGLDGQVWTAWWHGSWHDFVPLTGQTFPERTPIGALSRSPNYMDLVAVGHDGRVWLNWWNGDWKGWSPIGDVNLPAHTPIATLSRNPNHMELFAVGHDGRVWLNWWNGNWHSWVPHGDARFPAGTPIATLSRNPNQMDIFAVGNDGGVWWREWHGQWRPWQRLGTIVFPHRATIAANSRNPNAMNLFVAGHDGRVWTLGWNGTWGEWQFVNAEVVVTPGAAVAVVSRNPNQIDLLALGDGGIRSAWWHGTWNSWYRLPWSLRSWSRAIDSAGLAALGGWATVALLDDGSVRYYGHAKNSGIDSYGVSLAVTIRSTNNQAAVLAVHHHGQVPDHDFHDWDEWVPPHRDVIDHLDAYLAGSMASNLQYSSSIADAIRDTFAWTTSLLIGWTPAGLAIAPIAMLIGGFISWVGEGSWLPGLTATGSSVWMTGPTGMLFAYPTQLAVGAIVQSRAMWPDEIEWAKEIFGDTLPFDRIRVTNLIGISDRPFCAMTATNLITVNMGQRAHDGDARDASVVWGETLCHELVHAWQLTHSNNTVMIARVLAAQLQDITGNPYEAGVGAPWSVYNPEAQGNLISRWYREHLLPAAEGVRRLDGLKTAEATADPRFRYVRDHIRKATY